MNALELIARSLRAGHPLVGAFRFVADELDPPVSLLFADICQQQALGLSLEDALRKVAETSTSEDLKIITTSIAIQLRSGGNLADMLDRLAYVIRERLRLSRRVRVITSQTQFSKRILLVLPFFVLLSLLFIKPDYLHPFRESVAGVIMAVGACVSMLLGWLMMNRMAMLRY